LISSSNFGLKAGYDFDSFRVYGAYIYDFQAKKSLGDEDGTVIKWSTHKFIVGADYTPELTKDIKLVLGGYTGYLKLEMDIFDIHDGSEKANTNDWILGARIGAEYSINENNAVEFGLKADRTKYSSIAKYDNAKIKDTNVGLYLGYTYKF
jgi:putative outer membrane protein